MVARYGADGQVHEDGCSNAIIGFLVFVVFASVLGVVLYDTTIGRSNRCDQQILTGEVRRLDWSGGWRSGVLIECDTGSRIVRSRDHLPAVGDRGYVCANKHWHGTR